MRVIIKAAKWYWNENARVWNAMRPYHPMILAVLWMAVSVAVLIGGKK